MTLRYLATAHIGGDDSSRYRVANKSREVISEEGNGAYTVAGLNIAHDFDVMAFPCLRPNGRRPRAGSDQHGEVGGGDGETGVALQGLPEGPLRGV
jgi:hypothetical protein